jgi:3-dehydroquinate synthetase
MNALAPEAPLRLPDLRVGSQATCHHRIGPGALEGPAAPWPADVGQAVVIADRTALGLHGPRLRAALARRVGRVHVLTVAPGESSKSRRTALRLADRLLALGVGRDDLVVGFGGGVALDLAGFVAAFTLRGLPLVQVPTTLLAMIDAGLGGKAAVDTPLGKNLLGAFWWPRAVLIEPAFLATLAPAELRNGLAEGVKHAVLGARSALDKTAVATPVATAEPAVQPVENTTDRLLALLPGGGPPDPRPGPELFDRLERFAAGWDGATPPPAALVAELAAVKLGVVERDPFEAGERRTLNFGHTVGHALEACSGFELAHGAAVAVGMIVEGRVARARCGFPDADLARLVALLGRLGLPTAPATSFAQALPFLARDKKNLNGRLRLALPRRLGEMEPAGGRWAVEVEAGELEAAWHAR